MAKSRSLGWSNFLRRAVTLAAIVFTTRASADEVLQTTGFNNCNQTSLIVVHRANIRYNNSNKIITFDVAGTSTKVQNVTAVLEVTAYGQSIYSDSFNPCDDETFVNKLCPVPIGAFSATGTQQIPDEFADLVPAIAFEIPDIASLAQLRLVSSEDNVDVACVEAEVSNGKTAATPAVSYVAASIAGAALIMTGIASAGAAITGGSISLAGAGGLAGGAPGGTGGVAGSSGGASTLSPSFTEVMGWMQGMVMNGMLSVNYPTVYRKFSKNFAFSVGLIPWNQMQVNIDNFRGATGGNLTADSMEILRNTTLVFPDGSTKTPSSIFKVRRSFEHMVILAARQIDGIETSVNSSLPDNATSEVEAATASIRKAVSGITAYVEELAVPKSNTFLTVLLVVSIVIAAIVVGILLVKVVLECWALFASFPKSLAGFREHYWGSIARTVTSLILLLYGVWVLYCVFQFMQGDSWAAKALAGVSLFLFTAILAFFSWKIYTTAQQLKQVEGDASGLYDDKNIWVRYSLFYESYRKDYWWIFVPTIIYMFAKGCALAVADGHGMAQTAAQLIVEGFMLILLLWSRPYERRSGNIINIAIQVVRVLSVCCILVFVQEFGIAQTTQTVAGVVLIAMQSSLTGILAILIAWNALNACCKQNPHRKRRKMMEKMQYSENDPFTSLDIRKDEVSTTFHVAPISEKPASNVTSNSQNVSPGSYRISPKPKDRLSSISQKYRSLTLSVPAGNQSGDNLVFGAAPISQSSILTQFTTPNQSYKNLYRDNSEYSNYQGSHAQIRSGVRRI